MSQVNVERVIGILATDEAMRRRFAHNPRAVLNDLMERGMELTAGEQVSLAGLDPKVLARFSRYIDDRLQRCDLSHGGSHLKEGVS
jgi:hypothetical protein